jgi:hypothetical protein
MKILAALSKLKGKLKIDPGHPDVSITEDKEQVSITKSYTIKGVDLSDEITGIRAEEGTEDWIEEVEREVSHYLQGLKKDFTNFERNTVSHDMYFKNDENLLGFNVEASIRASGEKGNNYGLIESKEDLTKLTLEVEIVAFYDIPHRRIERMLDEGIKALTGLEIK